MEEIVKKTPDKNVQQSKIRVLFEINKIELEYKMAVIAVDRDYYSTFMGFKRLVISGSRSRADDQEQAK